MRVTTLKRPFLSVTKLAVPLIVKRLCSNFFSLNFLTSSPEPLVDKDFNSFWEVQHTANHALKLLFPCENFQRVFPIRELDSCPALALLQTIADLNVSLTNFNIKFFKNVTSYGMPTTSRHARRKYWVFSQQSLSDSPKRSTNLLFTFFAITVYASNLLRYFICQSRDICTHIWFSFHEQLNQFCFTKSVQQGFRVSTSHSNYNVTKSRYKFCYLWDISTQIYHMKKIA